MCNKHYKNNVKVFTGILTITILGANSADDKLMIFFFSRKSVLTFHANIYMLCAEIITLHAKN